jgi:hypothetical protein
LKTAPNDDVGVLLSCDIRITGVRWSWASRMSTTHVKIMQSNGGLIDALQEEFFDALENQ